MDEHARLARPQLMRTYVLQVACTVAGLQWEVGWKRRRRQVSHARESCPSVHQSCVYAQHDGCIDRRCVPVVDCWLAAVGRPALPESGSACRCKQVPTGTILQLHLASWMQPAAEVMPKCFISSRESPQGTEVTIS
jgi:hypothetical protein